MVIAVNGSISVDQGHAISDEVERRLGEKYPRDLRKVNIHYHPYETKKRI
ncbi:MAG: cation transporter dimerization domain-containing protein [Candidatus Cloacimonadaceae bacterium]|nr:cation transporter dimerization domain-containing protein [Candidatus Cloacimonadaceae bacterium]